MTIAANRVFENMLHNQEPALVRAEKSANAAGVSTAVSRAVRKYAAGLRSRDGEQAKALTKSIENGFAAIADKLPVDFNNVRKALNAYDPPGFDASRFFFAVDGEPGCYRLDIAGFCAWYLAAVGGAR